MRPLEPTNITRNQSPSRFLSGARACAPRQVPTLSARHALAILAAALGLQLAVSLFAVAPADDSDGGRVVASAGGTIGRGGGIDSAGLAPTASQESQDGTHEAALASPPPAAPPLGPAFSSDAGLPLIGHSALAVDGMLRARQVARRVKLEADAAAKATKETDEAATARAAAVEAAGGPTGGALGGALETDLSRRQRAAAERAEAVLAAGPLAGLTGGGGRGAGQG